MITTILPSTLRNFASCATIDKPGDNHGVAHDLLAEVFKAGLRPSQIAIDLLQVAAIAYTADLRIWRGYDTEDAWSRDISIHVPVIGRCTLEGCRAEAHQASLLPDRRRVGHKLPRKSSLCRAHDREASGASARFRLSLLGRTGFLRRSD